MKPVIFHPFTDQELIDAAASYKEQKVEPGLEYLSEVENAINFLICYSEADSIVHGFIRRLVLPRFPYYLLYRVLENDQLRILALAHHRRSPEYGFDRR